jgi:hypothetical protein
MPESVLLQPRDFALLQGLFESRVMTLSHIAALFFEGKDEAAKKRVQKLKAGGFIGERPRRVNEPGILFLTRKGFATAETEGLLSEFPKCSAASFEKRVAISPLTLRHELDVLDVKASLVSAIQKTERFKVAEFCTWPLLHSFEASHPKTKASVVVKPDGFIRIHEDDPDGGLSEHTFFLEVDRSTESQEVLATKAHCYLDYYRSGGFAVSCGGERSAYKEFPFRVLIVCKSEERRDNAAKRLLQNNPPILTQVWVTTLGEISKSPLGEIWVRPRNYYDSAQSLSNIQKLSLLS